MKDDRLYLGHGYMGIDLEEVWNVISDHLPNLKKAVTDLLA